MQIIAILLYYYHFAAVAASNKTVCHAWKRDHPQKETKNEVRVELSESTMNLIALKELLPNSKFINIRNTHQLLIKLVQSPNVKDKKHLFVMLPYFEDLHHQSLAMKK